MGANFADQRCPVCLTSTTAYFADKRREYRHCPECSAVHVPRRFHLSEVDEKAEYDKHENDINDDGYRRFLARMMDPLLSTLKRGDRGLDFGCGPGPALAAMLEERGLSVSVFDKYYANNTHVLAQTYDFICATEVVEHLREPFATLEQLWKILQPSGILGIMTKRVQNLEKFQTWHYKNDPTHIVFFHEDTFHWVASRLNAKVNFVSDDVVLLSKSSVTTQP